MRFKSITRKTLFCFAAVATLLVSNLAVAVEIPIDSTTAQKQISTIGGVLEIKNDPKDDLFQYLTLAKKKVTAFGQNSNLRFDHKFSISGADVVVVSSNQMANYDSTEYKFLTISPQGKVLVAEVQMPEALTGFVGDEPFEQTGDEIKLTKVQKDGRKTKTYVWLFSNGTVKRIR